MPHRHSLGIGCSCFFAWLALYTLMMWPVTAVAAPPGVAIGAKAPGFEAALITELKVGPALPIELRGQDIILEFWATWCGPCVNAREHLTDLHKQFSDRQLRIIAVTDEPVESVRAYLRKHPVPFEVMSDVTRKTHMAYGIRGIPHALLIDKEGIVRWIGDPRRLSESKLDHYLRTGEPPRSWYATTTQPAAPASEPILIIEISHSRLKERSRKGVMQSISSKDYQFKCTGQPLGSILGLLLEVSRCRLMMDPAIPTVLYDVSFYHEPVNGCKPDRSLVVDAICREAGLRLVEAFEEQDVWVARRGEAVPPKGSGGYGISRDKHGRRVLRQVTLSEFLRSLEEQFDVLIDDETNFQGRYNLAYKFNESFEDVRSSVSEEYGIVLTLEKRKTRLFRVRRVDK